MYVDSVLFEIQNLRKRGGHEVVGGSKVVQLVQGLLAQKIHLLLSHSTFERRCYTSNIRYVVCGL